MPLNNTAGANLVGIVAGGDAFAATLPDGTAVERLMSGVRIPATVWVEPNTGDTVTVTYRASATATAQAWPSGPVTAYAENVLNAPVYSIIFQRTAGSSALSKYGVAQ